MHSEKQTLEKAVEEFSFMRSHQPYKLGGKWFIAKTADGFTAYRTKKAAINNTTTDQVWLLDFSGK
jgi:hypothetical protein